MSPVVSLSTVMVVDDEPLVRSMVSSVLRRSGYKVVDAATSQQALDVLDCGSDVQLLLTDVMMPGVDGCELAARMRRIRPGIRVMFMSGYGRGAAGSEVMAGAPFLPKPFRISELLDVVKKALA